MFIQHLSRYLEYYKILGKTWNVNKSSDRTTVRVAYDIHGSKPSENNKRIIVLHGLLGYKRNWRSMCQKIAIAHSACVIATDARNHGESPHHGSHTYFDLASDVSQLMDVLSIKNAHIIGHSMGGRTGMTLALTEPSKVASLIVVDISPVPSGAVNHEFFGKLADVMKSVNFQAADNINKAREAAAKKILASGLMPNMKGMEFLTMNIGKLAERTFGWQCNLDALKKHIKDIASFPAELAGKQYQGPILFIGGGRSHHLPKSDEPKIKEYFPNAEFKYIEDAGHNIHAENPTAFFKIVDDFLSKHL